jgi:hypothetical protein
VVTTALTIASIMVNLWLYTVVKLLSRFKVKVIENNLLVDRGHYKNEFKGLVLIKGEQSYAYRLVIA